MRDLLQVEFLGLLRINAEGMVAISAAVLIVVAILMLCRQSKGR